MWLVCDIKSGLVLQMSLHFNTAFSPIWLLVLSASYVSRVKDDYLISWQACWNLSLQCFRKASVGSLMWCWQRVWCWWQLLKCSAYALVSQETREKTRASFQHSGSSLSSCSPRWLASLCWWRPVCETLHPCSLQPSSWRWWPLSWFQPSQLCRRSSGTAHSTRQQPIKTTSNHWWLQLN